MKIFPAIDLYGGKAVRLYKGDYSKMTVYSERPLELAEAFAAKGASCLHLVDLEGARDGTTPNIELIKLIAEASDMTVEVGGGIRSLEVAEKYLESGVDRVILGTAAVRDEEFLRSAVRNFGEAAVVGVDLRDGCVATSGWTENSGIDCFDFCEKLEGLGVSSVIVTDISKDGAMRGTNHELYGELSRRCRMKLTASGGVSSLDDVRRLAQLGIYGAIIGKAYYTGDIDLAEAVKLGEVGE